ncbi:MAG: putative symporter [Phycisphaerales bacterium]|nr:putative symporter [Phycisphaerales bacterium]
MIYHFTWPPFIVFSLFVGAVLAISFHFGKKARSAKGYYAAHGQIHWFVNGIAFAGDYLSAASFLGICGMIAFYGYDGFLYSIGYLAGWIVALFVIAEPLKRLGKFTFADALDKKFNSRGIKLTAAVSTLIVSIFYLIPQMVGAGALVKPLLGFPEYVGVVLVGVVVVLIVVTAGMVSTTYVQFIKGSLLVIFCLLLTVMILNRGLTTQAAPGAHEFRMVPLAEVLAKPGAQLLAPDGEWAGRPGDAFPPYVRVKNADGSVTTWRKPSKDAASVMATQTLAKVGGHLVVNGLPQGSEKGEADLFPVGQVSKLPNGQTATGPLGPLEYLSTLQNSEIVLWGSEDVKSADGTKTTVYFPKPTKGSAIMVPGGSPTFAGVSPKYKKPDATLKKIDFLSLMLALFCGTASLPHILIRYYTVKDQAAARKSTVVGIAAIGFFYVLTLFLGLGAMTSGAIDLTNNAMSAPLLARTFGPMLFAVISAIAFTTVLGTVSGLILAASGAVAHDLMTNFLRLAMSDHDKVRAGKIVAVIVGVIAIVLGIACKAMNPTFLVGWAFNVAASANLPALVMLLFWKRTTKQGITAAITIGLISSLGWLLLSAPAYKDVYNLDPKNALAPFTQPGIVTIPLGFLVLVVVSLMTKPQEPAEKRAFEVVPGAA